MDHLLFLIPVWALALLVALHVALLRLFPAAPMNRLFLLSFAVGLAGTVATDVLIGAGATSWRAWLNRALPDTLAYASLAYSYFHFFNMSETGRRVRLVLELLAAPDGMSAAQLLKRYPASVVVANRVHRLLDGRQIVERKGRLYRGEGRAMVFAAGAVLLLKRVVFGPPLAQLPRRS